MSNTRRGVHCTSAKIKNLKNKKGITLIALVLTIIVLLILAGVALNLVLGEDGITGRAVNARKTQNITGATEKVELEVANLGSEFYQAKYVSGGLPSGVTTVGDYVLSKLGDGDVYTGTAYTKDDGWLFLSKTEEGNGKFTVNLMSAGIPAKLYYHCSTNAPGDWWGTQVEAGSSSANRKAAYGLEHKFESITFEQNINPVANGNGSYTSIGTESGEVTGAIFKAGSNVSVHNMTYDEVDSLGSNAARKVGTGSSYYWLASPYTDHTDSLCYVYTDGSIDDYFNRDSAYGVRPVVSISGVTIE